MRCAPGDAPNVRVPRETDRVALLKTLAIKDALIRQLEATLLLPPPDQSITVQLSRRAQALVANARRREAVLACKLKALGAELDGYRQREAEAARVNHGLKRRLRDALTDLDAINMRREVRSLRADLGAALAREAKLQHALLLANQRIEADQFSLSQQSAKETKLRDDMDYVRRVASAAMAARAADAMGVPQSGVAAAAAYL